MCISVVCIACLWLENVLKTINSACVNIFWCSWYFRFSSSQRAANELCCTQIDAKWSVAHGWGRDWSNIRSHRDIILRNILSFERILLIEIVLRVWVKLLAFEALSGVQGALRGSRRWPGWRFTAGASIEKYYVISYVPRRALQHDELRGIRAQGGASWPTRPGRTMWWLWVVFSNTMRNVNIRFKNADFCIEH